MVFVPTSMQILALKRFQHDIETAGIAKGSDNHKSLTRAFVALETMRKGDSALEANVLEDLLFAHAKALASLRGDAT